MNELIVTLQNEMFEEAMKVQEHFMQLAENDGYFCTKSSSDDDRNEHWDVLMIKGIVNEKLYVDVKSEKLVTKQYDCTWIETQTVDKKLGWLYAPKLNGIVFEKSDRFIYVDINGIREVIDSKVSEEDKRTLYYGADAKPKDVREIMYKRYYRLGMKGQKRFDIVILIPFSDLDKYILKTFFK